MEKGGYAMLPYAVLFITLALLLYTVGVWSEKLQGGLRFWHLCFFWAGLVCDTTGTTLMGRLAGNGFQMNFHGVTGLIAVALMLVHAVWASAVLARRDGRRRATFHRFSIFVWLIWLVPYFSGMIFAMMK